MDGLRQAWTVLLLALCWSGQGQGAWDRDAELRLVKEFLDKSAPFGKVGAVGAVSDFPKHVKAEFVLAFLLGVVEKEQKLSTSGWLELSWKDSRLAWNASDYGGIDKLFVSQELVWKPDLFLENTLDVFPLPRSDAADSFVFVHSSGDLSWWAPATFRSSCQISVVKFPFDTQVCLMNFTSFYFDSEELNIERDSLNASLEQFTLNNEWDVVNFTVLDEEETSYPRIVYRLELKRRSMFHVLKLVVPTIILAIVNCFVMLVPDNSGERRSISLTIMLAWTVFISFVGEVAPANSNSVPFIAFFVIIHMAISALTSVMTMLPIWDRQDNIVHPAFDQNSPCQNHGTATEGRWASKTPTCCLRSPDYICFVIIVVLSVVNTVWCLVAISV